MVPLLRRRSRSLPLVEIQESAEPLAALDSADFSILGIRSADQSVFQTLVVAFEMVVLRVLGHRSPKMRLADRDDLR